MYYIDFNKAFNSVIQSGLWQLLEQFGFPRRLLQATKVLYDGTADTPLVNGHCLSRYPVRRGVRQLCPLYPTVFLIYIELLVRHIPSLIMDSLDSLHAFVDDILIRISSPFKAIKMLHFITTTATDYRADINMNKSEIDGMNLSPHFSYKSKQHHHI